jgi:hypothetical protein
MVGVDWKKMGKDTRRIYEKEIPRFVQKYSDTTVDIDGEPIRLGDVLPLSRGYIRLKKHPPKHVRIEIRIEPKGHLDDVYSTEEIEKLQAVKGTLIGEFATSVRMRAIPGYFRWIRGTNSLRSIYDPTCTTLRFSKDQYRIKPD